MADTLDEYVHTVDRVLNDILGIKPAEKIQTIARRIAPANVINDISGIDKPETMLSKAFQGADGAASKVLKSRARRPF